MNSLYKAKDANGNWVVGYFSGLESHICPKETGGMLKVDNKTICRSIGRLDIYGKDIFENDLMVFIHIDDTQGNGIADKLLFPIKWDYKRLMWCYDVGDELIPLYQYRDNIIINGNLFD